MTIQITKRHSPNLKLEKNIPHYWFGGDAFKTRLFDALSILFQDGEKFFISSVKNFFPYIKDPLLKEETRNFIFQESQHNLAHNFFNQHLTHQDEKIEKLRRKSGKFVRFCEFIFPSKLKLAFTVASEHMTAVFAHHGIKHHGVLGEAAPVMRSLYLWHAVEEIEHKAVAFDILKKIVKAGYFFRIFAMTIQSWAEFFHILILFRRLLQLDKQNHFRVWFRGIRWLFSRKGFNLWGMAKSYFVFYSPNFDPWKVGDLSGYKIWVEAYNKTNGDFIAAAEAVTDFQKKEKIKEQSTGHPYLSLSTNNQGFYDIPNQKIF